MAKNIILVIGDGMGWEMARSGAIYNQVSKEISSLKLAGQTDDQIKAVFANRTLDYYYTSGKGSGTPFQDLAGFQLVTNGATKIAGSTDNSALQGPVATHNTGEAVLRDGFIFDPTTNYVNWDSTKGGDAPWDADYYADRGKTSAGFDAGYIKTDYPDSANTASTLYGGTKTYNGAISVDIGEQAFASILMEAKAQGKSGGVVTSVPINHATPAAAVANVNSRNKYQESTNAGKFGVDGHPLALTDNIIDEILFDSKPQVVLGGGNPAGGETYVKKTLLTSLLDGTYRASTNVVSGKDATGKDIVIGQTPTGKTIKEEGWTVVGRPDDYTGANATKTGLELLQSAVSTFNPETDHLMGIYGAKGQGGNLPWRTADNDYSATGTDGYVTGSNLTAANTALKGSALAAELTANPTVAQLAGQALNALGKDKDGFWLMVEVGDIDWAAHADNMDLMLGTLHDMDDTVNTVTSWVAANGGWANNEVMVTADHDHYLTLLPNYPKEIAESILANYGSNNNEQSTGANNGYDLTLTPTLTKSGTSQWKPGDADAVGHFWGTTTTLTDASKTVGIGDGWWSHTQRPVPIYYQGEGSELVNSFVSTGVEAYGTVINGVPGMIDQSHVANAMEASLLGGNTAEQRLMTAQDSVVSPTLAFTSGDDNLLVANAAAQLTFKANTLFTGGGADEVNSELNSGFRNNIFTGSDADVIFAGIRDVITGGSGDDEIWANGGDGNRLSGNTGNDSFYIGTAGNRAMGGEGDDIFNILETAGTNYLNGGAGRDQFWLMPAKDKLPAKQFVMDFTAGDDKVGLRGATFAALSFTDVAGATLLKMDGVEVAQFMNVGSSILNNQANFVFA